MNTTMENKSDVYIYRVYFENNREARMMDIQEIIELVKKTKKFILNREMVSDVKRKRDCRLCNTSRYYSSKLLKRRIIYSGT